MQDFVSLQLYKQATINVTNIMKQAFKAISLFSSAFLFSLLACTNETTEKPTPPNPTNTDYLGVNIGTIHTGYPAGGDQYQISSNIPWEISWKSSWMSISPKSGEGNSKIDVSWNENATYEDRSDTVYIKGKKLQENFTILQRHKADTAHIISYRAIIGNLVKNEYDSIEVVFDKPVKVSEYVMDDGMIEVIPSPTITDEGKRFQLMAGSLGLGHELKMKMTFASLSDGTETKQEIVIPFYEKHYPLVEDGDAFRHSVLSEDEKSIWVSVTSQENLHHRVMQISLEDCSVLKSVDVPFGPRHLCINPYNHLLYVLPYNGDSSIGNSDTFCIVDPEQGKVIETIKIEQSPTAHHQHPTNYPDELEFTKDGFGILLLMSPTSTHREWRYVNSADGNKITLSGYTRLAEQYGNVHQNYDRTRIYANGEGTYHHIWYMSRKNPNPTALTIHSKFESEKYYAGGTLVDLRMSPFANKAFMCTAPGSQCVVNLDPVSYSEVLEEEARGSKCAWDGNSPDRDLIYQVCPTKPYLLEMFDMTKGELVLATYSELHYITNHGFKHFSDLMNCHFRKSTDQLVVVSMNGIYLLNATDLKKRMK